MYRQGDVLLIPTSDTAAGMEKEKRDNQRVVLAYGEVTGHAHAIKSVEADCYKNDKIRLLVIKKPVDLSHEEHSMLTLPVGTYRVVQQKEYSIGRIRHVAD